MITHACPTGSLTDLTLPCCGRTLDEVPPGDRVHSDEAKVTCGGES